MQSNTNPFLFHTMLRLLVLSGLGTAPYSAGATSACVVGYPNDSKVEARLAEIGLRINEGQIESLWSTQARSPLENAVVQIQSAAWMKWRIQRDWLIVGSDNFELFRSPEIASTSGLKSFLLSIPEEVSSFRRTEMELGTLGLSVDRESFKITGKITGRSPDSDNLILRALDRSGADLRISSGNSRKTTAGEAWLDRANLYYKNAEEGEVGFTLVHELEHVFSNTSKNLSRLIEISSVIADHAAPIGYRNYHRTDEVEANQAEHNFGGRSTERDRMIAFARYDVAILRKLLDGLSLGKVTIEGRAFTLPHQIRFIFPEGFNQFTVWVPVSTVLVEQNLIDPRNVTAAEPEAIEIVKQRISDMERLLSQEHAASQPNRFSAKPN